EFALGAVTCPYGNCKFVVFALNEDLLLLSVGGQQVVGVVLFLLFDFSFRGVESRLLVQQRLVVSLRLLA
ncbi:hypothetical protein RA266_28480, partial [Pseudomonas syringae pv. tagetis]|uniref:hypothetical protein n=1 Tax=Pseudomonas syringae group genomosp. 7 TaxID=251699 RepID=UPI0037703467